MVNESPSMQTWQAETYALYAVLGEVIAASNINDKIDWKRAVDSAFQRTHSDDIPLRMFIQNSIDGIREEVAESKKRNK